MDLSEPSPPVVAGGLALLVAAFAVREVAGGLLRAAGADAWQPAKRKAGR